jgi:hypothetical protein
VFWVFIEKGFLREFERNKGEIERIIIESSSLKFREPENMIKKAFCLLQISGFYIFPEKCSKKASRIQNLRIL